jgi:hypothetical protein
VCLGGVGVWQNPLASKSAGNPRDHSVFSILWILYAKFPGQLFLPGMSFSFQICLFVHVTDFYVWLLEKGEIEGIMTFLLSTHTPATAELCLGCGVS